MTSPALPIHPLTREEVEALTAPLTQAQILRAEPDIDYVKIMQSPTLRASARVFANCIGSLVALGYTHEWLASVLGRPVEDLSPAPGVQIPADLMDGALTVAIRIGNRWATPASTGLTGEQIELAKERARDEHRLPPAAYDPIYTYIPRSAPGHTQVPKRAHNARDALKIRALGLLVEQDGGTAASIGTRVGTTGKIVEKARHAVGLRVKQTGTGSVLLTPGQDAVTSLIRRAVLDLDAGDLHPTVIWTHLLAATADLAAAHVANQRDEVATAA